MRVFSGVCSPHPPGLGIAFVSAVHAKVPVLLHDRSPAQIKSGLSLFDKILAKDVSKGKLTSEAAKEARARVTVVDDLKHFRDADLVIEVRAYPLLSSMPRAPYAFLRCIPAFLSVYARM